MSKIDLKIDWASFEATKFACKNWHYSHSVPAGKLVKIGVWENKIFKGVVIFSRGANRSIGSPYNLDQTKVCELTRIALTKHYTPVTKIVSIAIKMLKDFCPDIKLIVSYADADQGHKGQIYKAGNWIYTGHILKDTKDASIVIRGKKTHGRTIHNRYGNQKDRLGFLHKNVDPTAYAFVTKGKHKFLYVLDEKIRDDIMKRSVVFNA